MGLALQLGVVPPIRLHPRHLVTLIHLHPLHLPLYSLALLRPLYPTILAYHPSYLPSPQGNWVPSDLRRCAALKPNESKHLPELNGYMFITNTTHT